ELEAFVMDRSHAPRVRRLAYEWLAKIDESAPDRIIPRMLTDTSDEMRRDAVARLLQAARQFEADGASEKARQTYEQALTGAVHKDQVDQIVAALEKRGKKIDIARHFGMLTTWKAIGPFDNRALIGFDVVYPPEKELDFQAEYTGQLGPVRCQDVVAQSEDGLDDVGK